MFRTNLIATTILPAANTVVSTVALAVALTIASSATNAAEIYRWEDERGNLVVSDRPPDDKATEYEIVNTGRNSPGRVWQRPGEDRREQVTPLVGGSGDNASSDPGLASVEKDPQVCADARKNLETLDTYARIRVQNEDGELVYLIEAEKVSQRATARRLITIHCD